MKRTTNAQGTIMKLLSISALAAGALLAISTANAAVPGILPAGGGNLTAPATVALTASADYSSPPDGAMIYSWGYGCTTGSVPGTQTVKSYSTTSTHGPAPSCPLMQLPGPTIILTEGQTVAVTLTNNLPKAAGNTSIIFSGFNVTTSGIGAVAGLRTQEAVNGGTVTYTFTATKPGTYAYYSGTQSDLQIEMGLYGAVIVVPAAVPTACTKTIGEFALANAAYDNNFSCYDREYLFQFAEMDSMVHDQVLQQVNACALLPLNAQCPQLAVTMEPYRANYYLINGRSMPDLMDTPFAAAYPHQPYNGNPQMHPGENMLMRVVGQGRWQHPFHFHGNHARVLARDGNMLLTDLVPVLGSPLAGPLLFTIPTVSGQSVDAIFNWTGQGLNWDVYGDQEGPATPGVKHTCNSLSIASPGFDPTTHEYCPDHGKPIPATPPDPQVVANGQWYGGTPYLGLSGFNPVNLPPGTLNQNPGAGYAYMWHSHNEREITTNDVFPGGMMMMMIVEPYNWPIDETL